MQLARLTKGINFAGNGMIVLDAGIRTNKVHNSHQNKRDWHRELAVQTAGFGVGGAAGIAAGKATAGALTAVGLGLTPVGWVILIGAAVAVGYYTATHVDTLAQEKVGNLYDRNILEGLM